MDGIFTTLFATVIVLGVLIFVHELGHFLTAKAFGVGVEVFSLGFGPKLFSRKYGYTEYRISWLPLGGYVKMTGESPTEEIATADVQRSFSHKNVWKRIAIVFAGPFSNLLFTVFVFFFMFLIVGIPHQTAHIGTVQEDTPAARAGLKAGDLIVSVNGQKIKEWDELSSSIKEGKGTPVDLGVEREDKIFDVKVTPEIKAIKNIWGDEIEVPLIGIGMSAKTFIERVGPLRAAWAGIDQTYELMRIMWLSIVKVIERKVSVKTVGGPIFIAQMAGQQAREGVVNLLFFMALISANLAIINLFPIPVLDGGHLFFFFMEVILRRPVNLRTREIAQQVGLFILVALIIFIIYNDIARISAQQ